MLILASLLLFLTSQIQCRVKSVHRKALICPFSTFSLAELSRRRGRHASPTSSWAWGWNDRGHFRSLTLRNDQAKFPPVVCPCPHPSPLSFLIKPHLHLDDAPRCQPSTPPSGSTPPPPSSRSPPNPANPCPARSPLASADRGLGQ